MTKEKTENEKRKLEDYKWKEKEWKKEIREYWKYYLIKENWMTS